MNKNYAVAVTGVVAIAIAALFAPVATVEASPTRKPRNVVNLFNSVELANTDALAADITPGRRVVAYRLTVGVSVTAVFNCQIDDGTTTLEFDFRDGDSLTAGRWYTFVIGAHEDYTYNFQVETNGNLTLLIDEIHGGML